jgi:hypothetical protein
VSGAAEPLTSDQYECHRLVHGADFDVSVEAAVNSLFQLITGARLEGICIRWVWLYGGFAEQVHGLWPVAVEQAKVAAINALCGQATYKEVVQRRAST